MARKKKAPVPEVPEVKSLTKDEMHRCDLDEIKKKLLNCESSLIEASRKYHMLEKVNCELRATLCGYKLIDKKNQINDFNTSEKGFFSEVCERLGIQEGFSYHPITGDIIPEGDTHE